MTNRSIIFVSCGQFTAEERALGKAIVKLVDSIPGMKAYFAEEVQDLNGLDSNILSKLRECDGFITVMHPRGDINRPDGSVFTRASVWIEQEIAIATYIRQIEKRPIPVIAFKHRSVGLEGIRNLIQLNPVEFSDETEVLAALPAVLEKWKALAPSGIRVQVKGTPIRQEDQHAIRQLQFSLVNDSGSRINEISGEIRVPAGILKHWSCGYGMDENLSEDGRFRIFRFDERICALRPIQPRSVGVISTMDYCTQCAIEDTRDSEAVGALIVAEYLVEITVWIDGREYSDAKTMKQLSSAA